jgi:membrane fusion protein, multidrug efflux system
MRIVLFRFVMLATVLLALVSCKKPVAPAPPQMLEVGVLIVQPQAVAVTTRLTGRTVASKVAEVRARVDGIVLKREFTEGGRVKAGQPLYTIDSALYQAKLKGAQAALEKAKAHLDTARTQAARIHTLLATDAVSQQDHDNALAAQAEAAADVAASRAAISAARINLDYTRVKAPISGQIGQSHVTQGAYVQAGAATLLAVVQAIDPMYVDIAQSSAEVLRLRRQIDSGQLKTEGKNEIAVDLILEDGSPYPLPGKLKFTDMTIAPTTGTMMLRAVFPNPDHLLAPGMFIRATLQQGVNQNALSIPQTSVVHNAKGEATVLVVGGHDESGVVELRTLQTTDRIGDQWIVSAGLQPGERVIVQGAQQGFVHIAPGMTVKAIPAKAGAVSVEINKKVR